jgi:cobaltochelatase CobN
MLETIRKGYWQPEPEVVETLAREYAREVEDLGLACCDHTCNNPALAEFITRTLVAVPGLEPRAAAIEAKLAAIRSERPRARQGESRRKAAPPPVRSAARPSISAPNSSEPSANAPEPVIGYELEPITPAEGASAPIPWLFLAGFAGIVCLIAAGWRRG